MGRFDSSASSTMAEMATFEIELPENMEEEEILTILEVLQNDIEGFDELVFETNETEMPTVAQVEPEPTVAQVEPEPTVAQVEPEPTIALQPEVFVPQPELINPEPEPQPLATASQVRQNNKPSRFRQLDAQGLLTLEQNQYSEATKKNTKWGTSVFNAWCMERLGSVVFFDTILRKELNDQLRQFYAEAQPKHLNKRAQSMPEQQAAEYHKNSLKNVRAALNRHLKDIGCDIDIVKDTEFKAANAMLNAKLKFNLRNGLSTPTKHHPIILEADIIKINEYLNIKNPVALRLKVWYLFAIHFVSRGCEFHPQLKISSLKFEKDENDKEYLIIAHETQQKSHQGGLDAKTEKTQDKRMYETGTDNFPIKAIKYLLSKTDPNANSLFNQCVKGSISSPNSQLYENWYNCEPVKVKNFSQFMPDICKNAGTPRFTEHSLRSTAITAMSDAGFSDRNIMFMSDHKCEHSLKSYCRRPSTAQKELISNVLENVATGEKNLPLPLVPLSRNSVIPVASGSSRAAVMPPSTNNVLAMNQQSNQMSSFATNSTFNNCHFHMYTGPANGNSGS